MLYTRMILLALVCAVLAGSGKEVVQEHSSTVENGKTARYIEKRMHQAMRRHHLPALALTVVEDQDILFQEVRGYADRENNIEATSNTVFKIWSVSKAFTALEIFREVEDGLIDLDQPVSSYLPDFSIRSLNHDEKPVTPKNLLAHRSGLPRNECITVSAPEGDDHALDLFEASIADCYMSFPPETRYKYSNLGYDLLGRIIEQNRGESYPRYMKDHLLDRLGMIHSTFASDEIPDPALIAKGYEYYKRDYYPMLQYDISSIPSGNLYSTIDDLTIFLKAVFSNTIFKQEETLSTMYEDHFSTLGDPEKMGLGWKTSEVLGDELLIWHDGGPVEGIGALVAFLPEWKLGIILIGNGTSFEGSISVPLAIDIFRKVLESKPGFELPKDEQPKRIAVNEQILHNYTGKYAIFGTMMDVKAKKDKLKGKIAGFGLNLIPVSDTEFKVTHWMDKIGLTKILRLPLEFNQLRIRFQSCDSKDSCYMVVNLANISHEICPRYPQTKHFPDSWNLSGNYRLFSRLPENEIGDATNSYFNISLEDSVWIMSGPFGPIAPIEGRFIKILAGPFAGEIMEYDPESGNLIHQDAVFIPVN